ncbi:zinc ribbon domain-containing protein [Haloglycomyces albus]|uniref:zinc ribbon domain-containing protein n=1 Tax=Haloglycomyces albus TaxID=526067 RepID=UPI00046CD59C|nr:hypothetical protein [Haloglycomyces albus]
MTRVDYFDQRRLLEVQVADTRTAQLRHRLRRVAEEYDTASIEASMTELRDGAGAFEAQYSDLERDLETVRRELVSVDKRADANRDIMASGDAPKPEMTRLQRELEQLNRRYGDLEERKVQINERRAQLKKAVGLIDEKLVELSEEKETREKKRVEAEAEYRTELDGVVTERERVAAALPDALIELYEKIRSKQPVGAAELVDSRCSSCRIEKTPNALKAIAEAPANDIVRCDDCDAILVRSDGAARKPQTSADSELDEFLN